MSNDNSVPPTTDEKPDMTAELLAVEIETTQQDLALLADKHRQFTEHAKAAEAEAADKQKHLRTLLAFRAMMRGEFAQLAPRDVAVRDDMLGLKIGPLVLAPTGQNASTRDLDYYEATLRAIADLAIGQARRVNDIRNERRAAAEPPTGAFPVQPVSACVCGEPLGTATAGECAYCGRPVATPADLDQVAVTPAATTLPDEAVRTDG